MAAEDRESHTASDRIADARKLGSGRPWLDHCLAVAGVTPIFAGVIVGLLDLSVSALVARFAIVWTGCLLAFLGGVRRGLTFSEVSGGRWSELATMIALFSVGVGTALFQTAALAAFGCLGVAILDASAARRNEVPAYFIWLRPVQFGLSAVVLGTLALRGPVGT